MNTIIEFLKNNMLDCLWSKYLNMQCPGCGMQRSIIFLLEGDLKSSLIIFPALIPTMILIFYLILHLIFKFKTGHKWILLMFIINVSIMIINYVIKIIY